MSRDEVEDLLARAADLARRKAELLAMMNNTGKTTTTTSPTPVAVVESEVKKKVRSSQEGRVNDVVEEEEEEDEDCSSCVVVSNIPLECSELELLELFHVIPSSSLPRSHMDQPSGYAPTHTTATFFFSFAEEAQQAISCLDGIPVRGSALRMQLGPMPNGQRAKKKAKKNHEKDASTISIHGTELSDWQLEWLNELLDNVTLSRSSIASLMRFCIEQSVHATSIVTHVYRYWIEEEEKHFPPPPSSATSNFSSDSAFSEDAHIASRHRHLALFYAVHDILCNTSVKGVFNAHSYKQLFLSQMTQIIPTLRKMAKSSGRISGAHFEQSVMEVFDLWKRHKIYPPLTVAALKYIFQKKQ